ncbi:CPBP family intramembrane glutamic endopeptidase [Halorarum halobium]|uniref:CPBP family intramembrane glutamic endopeptidase n=1 Tax=Halorarum halobium TaxID=3075121 RepID=UPI0028A633DE|nr:CPBP family intramembrane glutamic endopeptidase [Halobaculum sp. XH14]
MTDPRPTEEGGQELPAGDEPSARSIGKPLAVLRDRPSILAGLPLALLGQTVVVVVLGSFVVPSEAGLVLLFAPQWIAATTLVGFVLWVERRPLASVGITWPGWSDLPLGIGGAVVGLATLPVTIPLRDALGLGTNEGFLSMLVQLPLWAVLLVVITAAVTEELLFRAYPIERLAELTGSARLAAAVSVVAFMLLHVPAWGVGHLVTIGGITIVLTLLYLRCRRLGPVVVMHFLSNFVLLIVVPRLGSF